MRRLLTGEVRPGGLAAARILVALAAFPLILEWWFALHRVASGSYLVIPVVTWTPVPTPIMVQALVSLALLAAVLLLLGVFARTSAALTATVAGTALLLDQQTYSNHLVLFVSLAALLSCSRCGEVLTFPRRRGLSWVPYWPVFLIKLQISAVYAYTATSKINEQYLSGEVIGIHQNGVIEFPDAFLPIVAVSSVVAEYVLAVMLWFPRGKFVATAIGAGLHGGILLVFHDPIALVPFAMLMAAGYIQFWAKPYEPGSPEIGARRTAGDVFTGDRPVAPSTA
ncbi:vitamin K-dependent gamma-carboxylase-like protein [Georgenia soli]|uniref:Vitamin K-dependent gamma-carboxylase-like protein n=1 Tax=Georgenia soli TaxID=638953 RepID=A0A2A9EJ43_9MICO|nr:HTTM domain-containing protein [Georgenia soli]PFG38259.1 vitamin K-dependent gamma-carboxylase-like protein [Georgenia soli]